MFTCTYACECQTYQKSLPPSLLPSFLPSLPLSLPPYHNLLMDCQDLRDVSKDALAVLCTENGPPSLLEPLQGLLEHLRDFDVHVNVHERSVIETRQSKATTSEDNSLFSREKEELPQAGLEPATFCIPSRRSTN